MQEESARLDALSEMMALSSYANTKNLLITAIDVKGPLDQEALTSAVQQAAKHYPQFAGRIREIKAKQRHHLVWHLDPDLRVPVKTKNVPASSSGQCGPAFQSFLECIRPDLDKQLNLFNEGPAELHVLRFSPDHHIIAPVIHHVAADAGTASEFGRETLAHYHEILTGNTPDWFFQEHAMSSSKKRMVKLKEPKFKDFMVEFREAVTHLFESPGFPAGGGSPKETKQFHAKRVLSVDETERIGKICSEKGVSLVDILVAGTNLAVDEWNTARNVTPGILTTSMSVNMKGRFEGFNKANNSALMFFKSRPDERQDLAAFARAMALTRIKFFRNHMDFKFVQNVSRMVSSFRLFPFPIRRKIVNFLMNRHQFSVAVTLLGVVWPATKNGKLTAESCLTSAGNLEIREIHGVGYKLLSNTPILLIVYAFRNKLNLVLHASGKLFTKEESDVFMDVVMKNLMKYALELPAFRKESSRAV